MQDFKCNYKLIIMMWNLLSTKGQGVLDHEGGELVGQNFMVGQILKEFCEEKGNTSTINGKKVLKTFSPKLEAMAFYEFQTWQMCSHSRVETIKVVIVCYVRWELKGSIVSQAPLNWRGSHSRWMISGKHINKVWWKLWLAHANI